MMSDTLSSKTTSTLYGQVRLCWIKRRGLARTPDNSQRQA
jgi:hypothetical protein